MCVCVCMCIYIYTWLNHFAVHLKLTQHCKSALLQYKIKFKKKHASPVFIITHPSQLTGVNPFPAKPISPLSVPQEHPAVGVAPTSFCPSLSAAPCPRAFPDHSARRVPPPPATSTGNWVSIHSPRFQRQAPEGMVLEHHI